MISWQLAVSSWQKSQTAFTFAWLSFNRRLSKDYEKLACHSESMIYVASIALLVKRL